MTILNNSQTGRIVQFDNSYAIYGKATIERQRITGYYDDIIPMDGSEYTLNRVNKNFFDLSVHKDLSGLPNVTTNVFATSWEDKSIYVPCSANTTYTISKRQSKKFVIACCDETTIKSGTALNNIYQDDEADYITYTTSETARTLLVHYYDYSQSGVQYTAGDVRNSIQIELGEVKTDYVKGKMEMFDMELYRFKNIDMIIGHNCLFVNHPDIITTIVYLGVENAASDYSISINGDDMVTLYDFKAIPVRYNSPKPQTYMLDIPGRNGQIDLSNVFGRTKYDNYKQQYIFDKFMDFDKFESFRSEFLKKYHGQRVEIIQANDPAFKRVGRLEADITHDGVCMATITLDCDFEPYKQYIEETKVFFYSPSSLTLTVNNLDMDAVPTICAYDDGLSVQINKGAILKLEPYVEYTMYEMALKQGANEVKLTGTGEGRIVYQEATL